MKQNLIYIDQNVVGLVAENSISIPNSEAICWVYSSEHFREIQRSEDPSRYLDALDKLKARQLDLILDHQWKITGNAYVKDEPSARKNYSDFINVSGDIEVAESSLDPLLAWINGGGSDDTLAELPKKMAHQFFELTDSINQPDLNAKATAANEGMSATLVEMLRHGNDIERTRDALGLGKGRAGSFLPEKALLDIWELIKGTYEGLTSDQFYGFSPQPWQDEESIPIYLGIIGCCSVLDIIGFQSEKKIRRIDKVPNVKSDAGHIAMGAFCTGILSRDRRLINRAKAIYSYRNLSTQVIPLEI